MIFGLSVRSRMHCTRSRGTGTRPRACTYDHACCRYGIRITTGAAAGMRAGSVRSRTRCIRSHGTGTRSRACTHDHACCRYGIRITTGAAAGMRAGSVRSWTHYIRPRGTHQITDALHQVTKHQRGATTSRHYHHHKLTAWRHNAPTRTQDAIPLGIAFKTRARAITRARYCKEGIPPRGRCDPKR